MPGDHALHGGARDDAGGIRAQSRRCARAGTRRCAELAWLRKLERDIHKAAIDDEVWSAAHALARRCRKAGVTVPATDLLIAACARHHGAESLHRDADFAQIARVEGATRSSDD